MKEIAILLVSIGFTFVQIVGILIVGYIAIRVMND
tara:strand:+ start:142 stop:246 length:105 start_codon:yes stop_codon:yes gene_type:complete